MNIKDNINLSSDTQTLFIIGNGFDLHHGVKSSYFDFANYLKTHGGNKIKQTLETFLIAADLWGSFEENLAHLSRELLIESVGVMLDTIPDTLNPDDDDFSYADYYASIDMVCQPINDIEYELPKFFKKWVQSLIFTRNGTSFLKSILSKDCFYLNFNYTDFLESIYGIPADRILYVHGSRKDRKSNLILGHGENPDKNFDEWYERNKRRFTVHKRRYATKKNKKGKVIHYKRPESMTELAYFDPEPEKANWPSVMHYYAHENAVERIETYFEETKKDCRAIIKDHGGFFEKLETIKKIVILGHSLMPVDYPYFQEILTENSERNGVCWFISFFADSDIKRTEKFISAMEVSEKNVVLFRMQ